MHNEMYTCAYAPTSRAFRSRRFNDGEQYQRRNKSKCSIPMNKSGLLGIRSRRGQPLAESPRKTIFDFTIRRKRRDVHTVFRRSVLMKLYTRVSNAVVRAVPIALYDSFITRVNLTRACLISITCAHLERTSAISELYVNLLRADDFYFIFFLFFFESRSFAICAIDDFNTAVIELFGDRG